MKKKFMIGPKIYFFIVLHGRFRAVPLEKYNLLHFFLISRMLNIYPDLLTLDTDVKIVTTNETFWSHMSFQVDSKANGASASNAMYSPLLLFQPSMKMGAW